MKSIKPGGIKIITLILCLLFLTCNYVIASEVLYGKVINVSDGDTLTIAQGMKIRLYGIDCPEKNQDFGMDAKQFTSDMVLNKHVKVVVYDTDRYNRLVGMVYIGQRCLNAELIKNGFAWVYKKYCLESFCNTWSEFQKSSRTNKLGLWIQKNPVAPWDFRKKKKN